MKILFGTYMDGCRWSNKEASIGEVRVGPFGMADILITRLGANKPSVHPVHRINAYMERLKQIDDESQWFHESFAADSWSTSRLLLKWRDELVEAGWKKDMKIDASERLKCLYMLENIDTPIPDGWPERLQEIIEQLEKNKGVHISAVTLAEPITMLPPVWQRIFQLLQNQKTLIINSQENIIKNPDSNLKSVQAFMQNNEAKLPPLCKDDSLILLQAQNEWEAAEHLALWLASDADKNRNVTIICGRNTNILDEALRRHGLARLGRTEPTRFREIQQVLPLLLANIWKPIDIFLLAELLSLTTSPFPKYVCRYLLDAIAQEPGVNGRAWQHALEEIYKIYKQKLTDKEDTKAEQKAESFVKHIQSFLAEDRYDENEGIPEDKLRQRCQRIIDLFGLQIEDDPMLVEIVSHAREMQKLSIGKGNIKRNILERMLDTVVGVGSVSQDSFEEAGSWNAVDHPGQIADNCEELIWWGFNDYTASEPTYWTEKERFTLEKAGIYTEKTNDFRKREAYCWQQGFVKAQKRFICVYFEQEEGAQSCHHPFWDTIRFSASQIGSGASEEEVSDCLIKKCRDLDHKSQWVFAGRKQTLNIVKKETIKEPSYRYSIPPSDVFMPKRLSYSQMSTLIGCPLKWMLEYYAGIRMSKSYTIPTGSQMIGTFCHRIVEELFADTNKRWTPEEAYREAERLYDLLLPSMASELLLEGNSIEKQRYRLAVCEAVKQLVIHINKINLKVEKTEAYLEAPVNDILFVGYTDMLLRDAQGLPYVLDLKWSSSVKYRKQEIADGLSLQLASYSMLIKNIEQTPVVHTGYFMLSQGELISSSEALSDEAISCGCTQDEIWQMAIKTMNDVIQNLNNGTIEARGVMEIIEGLDDEKEKKNYIEQCRANMILYQYPPCNFCDFKILCGYAEVANE